MAETGGQPGNNNVIKGKRWQAAIDRALDKRSKAAGIEELDRLAEKFLDEVEKQGITGFKEFADRMDGKSVQPVAGTGDEGQHIFELRAPWMESVAKARGWV